MVRRFVVVLPFALAVWAFCGALIGVGRQFMSLEATLILHAVGAPVGAAAVAWLYFRRGAVTGPLATAAIFVATALALDLVVVALLIERSFAMFASLLGLWIPQALIFAATYVTGRLVEAKAASAEGKGRSSWQP